jgi:hypothetical protein
MNGNMQIQKSIIFINKEISKMEKNLFIDGASVLMIKDGKYYAVNEDTDWDYMKEVSRNDFIAELKRYSWCCLTSWDKELREQYLKMVDLCDKAM